jgi:hypothetical protein
MPPSLILYQHEINDETEYHARPKFKVFDMDMSNGWGINKM